MDMSLEQIIVQQLFSETTINEAEIWHNYAPAQYLIQLKLALVYFFFWLISLHYTDTKLWGK